MAWYDCSVKSKTVTYGEEELIDNESPLADGALYIQIEGSQPTPQPTIHLTIEGAKGDDITITDASGEIVSNVIFEAEETSKEVDISIISGTNYTFTSSVAKATDGSDANYSKLVTLSTNATNVKVMPDGALYWYGNECVGNTGGWIHGLGISNYGETAIAECTNTTKLSIVADSATSGRWYTNQKVDMTNATYLHFVVTSCKFGGGGIRGQADKNSNYPGAWGTKSTAGDYIPSPGDYTINMTGLEDMWVGFICYYYSYVHIPAIWVERT